MSKLILGGVLVLVGVLGLYNINTKSRDFKKVLCSIALLIAIGVLLFVAGYIETYFGDRWVQMASVVGLG